MKRRKAKRGRSAWPLGVSRLLLGVEKGSLMLGLVMGVIVLVGASVGRDAYFYNLTTLTTPKKTLCGDGPSYQGHISWPFVAHNATAWR